MWRLQSRLTDERMPRLDSENTCEQVSTSNRFKWPSERRMGRGGEDERRVEEEEERGDKGGW